MFDTTELVGKAEIWEEEFHLVAVHRWHSLWLNNTAAVVGEEFPHTVVVSPTALSNRNSIQPMLVLLAEVEVVHPNHIIHNRNINSNIHRYQLVLGW
jgi:hypothetical protein